MECKVASAIALSVFDWNLWMRLIVVGFEDHRTRWVSI
jgi:hypothetical protein